MGVVFSHPLDKLPAELMMHVARILLRDDPGAVGRLMSSSQALLQLARGDFEEAKELRAARELLTQQRVFELRVALGRHKFPADIYVRSTSRPLSLLELPLPAPVTGFDLRNWPRWLFATGEARALVVARLLRVSCSLAFLVLQGNTIGNAGAKALAAGVAASGSLTELHLCKNQIGDEGAKALAAGVVASGSLTKLYLHTNMIGDEGAKALAAAVAASASMTELLLGNNDIGDEGAKALADGVAASVSLTSLYLGWNRIGASGAKAVANAIRVSNTLSKLFLNDNNIGDEGAKAIAASLAASASLKMVRMPTQSGGHAELVAACYLNKIALHFS